ncbi:hypothetical protein [Macrococcus equipercicus]|uniref:Phage tail protein n=1 Tax=Macrococcus equipercicus TaxID=69967 RepID=A0A9Q9BPH0_9STAP|nr:hypothetical protein [Macrococcus equipercicus]UTH13291.1 hypothetical protein KFV11_08450 [Macrococcus equipercicus]
MRIRSTGFTYNGRHSLTYELRITELATPNPEAIEIRDKVPHMDGDYDFSAISGRQRYNNREITVKGYIQMGRNTSQFQTKRELTAWLLNKGWLQLVLDYEKDYYYVAKCTSLNFEHDIAKGHLNVDFKFEAKPYAVNIIDGSEVL